MWIKPELPNRNNNPEPSAARLKAQLSQLKKQFSFFNCWHKDSPEHTWQTGAMSRGEAKAAYLRRVSDCWPDVQYTDICVRKLELPEQNERFELVARQRGWPNARIGMRCTVSGEDGIIVGANSSGNFDVYFIRGKWQGCTHNCHPRWEFELVPELLCES